MKYLELANSNIMFVLVALTILVVVLQSLLFIRKALKRADELGIEKTAVKKVITNSAIFSIVPSLPILVMMFALAIPLGKYFPWLRLSVVGSAVYESMAANVAVVNMGLKDISDPGLTPTIFGIVLWVMTLGIIWGIVFNIFFMGKLDAMTKKAKSRQSNFMPIFSAALFAGMLAVLSIPYIANTAKPTAMVTFLVSGLAVLAAEQLSKTTKISLIKDFSLPIALIVGMGAAILFSNLA